MSPHPNARTPRAITVNAADVNDSKYNGQTVEVAIFWGENPTGNRNVFTLTHEEAVELELRLTKHLEEA